ncbi:WXG100 family type VII secretion target [Amycolatopsis sp. H20-H5]|uniref:WXG100 family type VII secretion target n=1 Tax=Amycolatopsis sp. H20-H5 TaxID=3046309 RepID=UPI002DB9D142|nr:WXG100 family type VII secretion target [Amycolatopsis sp. H20-H5]MEC3975222.1 WXG100 family type VII secretion target [Amycolatopsis sp. H20-H5]
MANYQFSFQLADMTRDHMATITMRMRTMLEELDGNVNKSLADWTSDARAAYQVSKQKWDDAAQKMPQSLQRAEVALNEISNGYLQVEHTGTNMWNGSVR